MEKNQSKCSSIAALAALQIFIPLSCVSVPFEAHGQAANRVASGSSSLHTTLVRNSSVRGPWPSSELCRKWFFKSSYHFHAYQFRSRPLAKQRTVSQVVLQMTPQPAQVAIQAQQKKRGVYIHKKKHKRQNAIVQLATMIS